MLKSERQRFDMNMSLISFIHVPWRILYASAREFPKIESTPVNQMQTLRKPRLMRFEHEEKMSGGASQFAISTLVGLAQHRVKLCTLRIWSTPSH